MTAQEKVQKWIDEGCDFSKGILLLSEIGKNPNLVKIMTGRPKTYAVKLKYELLKICKVKTKHVNNIAPSTVPPANDTKQDDTLVRKPDPKNLADEPREDWRDKPALKPAQTETYPPEIEKIKSEYSRLYNLRAQQHGLMTDVTPDNAPENVKKRKVLSDSIAEMSKRLELLHAAKEAYFENGTMPDMEALFGNPKANEPEQVELPNDIAELKRMKKTLQISIHKAKNKLEYQEETKQKRSNPMPSGPKRLDLEKTIAEKLEELEKIEFKIVDLAHTR